MTQKSEKTNSNMAAIIFAVFAVVCIVAFLAYRGSDVGQLPNLIGNLGGGPLFGPIDGFVGLLLAICIVFACWASVGSFAVSLLNAKVHWLTYYSLTVSIGAALLSLVWFILGVTGRYSTSMAWTVVLIGIALPWIGTLLRLVTRRGSITLPPSTSRVEPLGLTATERSLAGLIIVVLLITLIAALAPPTAKDALLYHFSIPKVFATQHSNAFVDGNIAGYLSLGTEMHYVSAMLISTIESPRSGEAAVGAVGFLFFPLLLLAVYGWARELAVSRTWSLLATLVVATVPTAYHVASSGYVDLSLALYVTLAAYGLTRWWKEQTWGWVILIGIFLGAALSVKLTAVFVFAAFALVVLFRARGAENAGRVVTTGLAAFVLAGAIASPWYIRTWVATGSPVFPFYMSIWPGKANGWDVERSNLFQGMNSQYGGIDTNKINYLTAPVRASVVAQPEQHTNYDGVLGVAFLIGLPLLIWGLWKFDLAVEIKIIAGVAGVMYLFWLFSSEQLRYILPIAPLLAIAIAASAEKIGNSISKVAQGALVAASICGLLTTVAWFCMKAPLRVVLGGETREQYLTRNLDYYPYYKWINTETPTDAKVWLINMRRDTYHIERPIFSDYLFEDWTFRKMLWESSSVQEMRTKTAAMGTQYVLARHDLWFDYDRSTLVDDKKPRAENEAKLKIARDYILDPANTIKSDNKFSLIKVF